METAEEWRTRRPNAIPRAARRALRERTPLVLLDIVVVIIAPGRARMDHLGELEYTVLLAVLQAGAEAYGVEIRDEIRRRARRDLTLGTIYKTLARLEAKGLVAARRGEPTPVRGGRAKRYYDVTANGRRAMRTSLAALRRMAAGLDVGLDVP